MPDNKDAMGGDLAEKLSNLEKKISELEGDNFKLREKRRELEAKFQGFEEEKKTLETKKLEETNQWKTLYERSQESLKAKDEIIGGFKEKEKSGKKNSALLKELTKHGFNAKFTTEAFKLIDTKSVGFDEETGVVMGADTAAKEFVTKYGDLPWFDKKDPGLNHNGSGNGKGPSLDIANMSKADLKKYYEEKQRRGR
jgi:hypothetical protein